ncbi:MAG: xanthine dehydrogenase family protein subunit M [Planctomycetes bacterium]|nr:xanthine dehydrogenase family protein subunit M [Planctomycetota bacterium]
MRGFKLFRPATLDEAVALLPGGRGPAEPHDARPLAGGQDLLTELKDHLVEPDALVDLTGLHELEALEVGDALRIGALCKVAALEHQPTLRAHWTVLAEAAASVASPQIRSQATVGGNLCQRPRCWYYRNEAAPCIKKGGSECFAESGMNKYNAILGGGPSYIVHPSDLAPALVCLDATVTVSGARGPRSLPLEEFFTLPTEGSIVRENVLKANELLLSLDVPSLGAGWTSTYLKARERGSYDFALASCALAVKLEGERIAAARLVLGGVAPIPWRCPDAEAFLAGKPNTPETWAAAAALATKGAEPLEHNGYKVHLAQGLVQKALRRLAGQEPTHAGGAR